MAVSLFLFARPALAKDFNHLERSQAPMIADFSGKIIPAKQDAHTESGTSGYAEIADAIRDASYRTGIRYEYLLAKAQIESGLDPNAKARQSTATGLFQFIDATWITLAARHANTGYSGPQSSRAQILAKRYDPYDSALMAARYAKMNKAAVEIVLHREATGAELYLAHFLGTGGAKRFLKVWKRSPHTAAAAMFPRAARANRPVFFNRAGRARSLDQVRSLIAAKLNTALEDAVIKTGEQKSLVVESLTASNAGIPEITKNAIFEGLERKSSQAAPAIIDEILTASHPGKKRFTLAFDVRSPTCNHTLVCYGARMSTSTITRVRELVNSGEMTRAGLARAAGLHANTLRDAAEPDWNPTAETLQKLEVFLNSNDDRPVLVGIEEIIDEARNGKMYILVDDEDRENEGDLIIPAQMATPAAINFMATHGRGLICLALDKERVDQLGLEPMSRNNKESMQTAFTISIEAKEGVTTGISAADRARTVSVAIDSTKGADDIVTPGHVFPLAARDGGTLVRAGHTEAAVDISRLAGLNPSGVICEIMNEDGTMARLDDLVEFARRHDLKIGTIRDLIAYRMRNDHLVERLGESAFESEFGGQWRMITYRDRVANDEAYVLQKGHVVDGEPTLARVHPINVFDDVLGAPGPRKNTLQRSMQAIGDHGSGVIVILTTRVGTGSEWTKDEEIRNIGIGSQILADLGVHDMVLLSNSRPDLVALEGYGIAITDFQSIPE